MTLHSHFESDLEDALNLGTRIDIGIEGFVVILIFLSKIHATSQFANHHEVGTAQ